VFHCFLRDFCVETHRGRLASVTGQKATLYWREQESDMPPPQEPQRLSLLCRSDMA
jgi:hypothetical protein